MEITEVRIKLMSSKNDKLRAFCSITLDDCFVIRDLKIIEGTKGPFVAMPSRKLTERCKRCGEKNPHRSKFCNECGVRVSPSRLGPEAMSRLKMHADIAHPINQRCRELIQSRVIEEYSLELDRAKDPDYRPPELEDYDDDALAEAGETIGADPTPEPEPINAASVAGAFGSEHRNLRQGPRPERERNPSENRRPVEPSPARDSGRKSFERKEARGGELREPLRALRPELEPDRSVPAEAAEFSPAGPGAQRASSEWLKEPLARAPSDEPEDNFGAGLFS